MKNTKRAPKGTPTHLNIGALAELVAHHGGRTEFPNSIPNDIAGEHIRRCVRAGWLVVVDRKSLRITEEARTAVVAHMAKELSWWNMHGTNNYPHLAARKLSFDAAIIMLGVVS